VTLRIALLATFLSAACSAHADVRLPRLIGDNMVLQRGVALRLWGWADAAERVRITFRGRTLRTVTDAAGRWSILLPAQRAGGPYPMSIVGNNRVTINNVLLGDVWLASGQSNMQFPMMREGNFGGVKNAEQEIATANFPQIRLFMVDRATALHPAADVKSSGWSAATPESVRAFSAVAYLFGRELHQRYRIPLGIIESTWGGTPAETWMSEDALTPFPEFDAAIAREARVDARSIADYDAYLAARNQWYRLHGREDRGSAPPEAWAAADLDTSAWPTMAEPRPWPIKPPKGFDGTVWYRTQIEVLPSEAGKSIRLHLPHILNADTTYFDGVRVGATVGEAVRDYLVPGVLVKAGRNSITVRIEGQYDSGDGYVGMLGDAHDLYAELGGRAIPLAGIWRFQAGPDVSDLPDPPPLAEFRSKFPQSPTLLFNAMIAPLVPYGLKGVIWYQGENNVGRAAQYRALFPALINDWRARWRSQLPFLFVQLAGFEADPAQPAPCERAELREAQSAALFLARTAMASAIDVGDRDDVHPNNKQAVAHRLALAAMAVAYGEHMVYSGPTFRAMQIEGSQIRIQFANQGSRLRVEGDEQGEVRGFAIAARDRHFVWARARLDGADVLVSSDEVASPTSVSYDWGNTPRGNLYNSEGLPAPPFRTAFKD
jgi:sialate O-acetylesterase